MIINLRPPDAAGPLRIGASRQDTLDALERLGAPAPFGRVTVDLPGLAVDRPSGLFIGAHFDAQDRLEAIELGRPGKTADDEVRYDGLDVFTTPALGLVAHLRQRTPVVEEEDGHAFTAPDLLVSFWRPTVPETPDDEEGRYFASVLLARPGYYDEPD